MRDAVICEPVRTPVGRYNGALKDHTAQELGAIVVRELMNRTGLEPSSVDDLVLGHCYPTMDAPAIGRVVYQPPGIGPLAVERRQSGLAWAEQGDVGRGHSGIDQGANDRAHHRRRLPERGVQREHHVVARHDGPSQRRIAERFGQGSGHGPGHVGDRRASRRGAPCHRRRRRRCWRQQLERQRGVFPVGQLDRGNR